MRGQGLLETTVAIGVITALSAAVLALLLSSRAGSAAELGRIQGQYLAAEGIEVVRAVRDGNVAAGKEWWGGLTNIQNDGTLAAEYDPTAAEWIFRFDAVDSIKDPQAAFKKVALDEGGDPDSGMWIQGETFFWNEDTGFARLITLYPICEDTVGTDGERTAAPGEQCAATERLIGVEITSFVLWTTERGKTNTVTLASRIYGWQ